MTDNNTSERKPLILIAEDVESNYKLGDTIPFTITVKNIHAVLPAAPASTEAGTAALRHAYIS